jgi:hypothetical protein
VLVTEVDGILALQVDGAEVTELGTTVLADDFTGMPGAIGIQP